MSTARADHAMVWFKGSIFVLGGMGPLEKSIQSLNSCEVYNIKEDKWKTLTPF